MNSEINTTGITIQNTSQKWPRTKARLRPNAARIPDRSTVLDQAAAADLRSAVGRTLSEATEDQASVAVVLDSVSLLGRLDQLVAELTDSALVPVAMGGDAHP